MLIIDLYSNYIILYIMPFALLTHLVNGLKCSSLKMSPINDIYELSV